MHRWRPVLIVVGLVAFGVAGRLVPHLPNFAPVLAASLCAGLWLRSKWAAVVPLAAMGISDAIIGGYHPLVMATVYTSLVAATWAHAVLGDKPGRLKLAATMLALSVMYFLTTNLAVWAFDGIYDLTPAGLGRCYLSALPFFRYALAGDMTYLAVLLGAAALATRYWPRIEDELLPRRRAYARVKR